jgi:hypothetical protein
VDIKGAVMENLFFFVVVVFGIIVFVLYNFIIGELDE